MHAIQHSTSYAWADGTGTGTGFVQWGSGEPHAGDALCGYMAQSGGTSLTRAHLECACALNLRVVAALDA